MPSLTTAPATSYVPVGNLDAVKYGITPIFGEHILSTGSYPSLTVQFNSTPQPTNGFIVVFGKTFTVNNTATNSGNINLFDADAEQQAVNFIQGVTASIELFPFVEILQSIAVGLLWQVTMTYKIRVAIPTVLDDSGLTIPLPLATSNIGSAPTLEEGYKIAYQLFEGNLIGSAPITALRHVSPKIGNGSLAVNEETVIDASKQAGLIVSTTKPFNIASTTPFEDTTFSKEIFLRFGSQISDGNSTTWGSFADSDIVKAVNVALPIGHVMDDYLHNTRGGDYKFLTLSPRIVNICKNGEYHWLWFIANVEEEEGVNACQLKYTLNYATGVTVVKTYTMPGDGVFCIPCGTANFPYDLKGVISYSIKVEFQKAFGTSSTETFTFDLQDACQCTEPYSEIYFLEPLGGYGTLPIHKVEMVEVEQENGYFETPIDNSLGAENKMLNNGVALHSPRSFERITLTVRVRFTNSNYAFVKGLRSSKERFVRYKVNGTNEVYRFTPDAGTMEIYKYEDWVFAKMSGMVHLPLPVLENGAI